MVLMRLMKSLLFGISPLDPLTYAAVPVVLVAARGARQLSASTARCAGGSRGSSQGGVTVKQYHERTGTIQI